MLQITMPDEKTTLTFEGEAQEFLSYQIRELELRFSDDFIDLLSAALPPNRIQ